MKKFFTSLLLMLFAVVGVYADANVTAEYSNGKVILTWPDYAAGYVEMPGEKRTISVWNEVIKVAELTDGQNAETGNYNQLKFNLSEELQPGTYTIKIPAGAVQGNKNDAWGAPTAIEAGEATFEIKGSGATGGDEEKYASWFGDATPEPADKSTITELKWLKFNYSNNKVPDLGYSLKANYETVATLSKGDEVIATAKLEFSMSNFQIGFAFNATLEDGTYTVNIPEGAWGIYSVTTVNDEDVETLLANSPATTFTYYVGGGAPDDPTPPVADGWKFKSVTPAEGEVASIGTIKFSYKGTDEGGINEGMVMVKLIDDKGNEYKYSMDDDFSSAVVATRVGTTDPITEPGTYTMTIPAGVMTGFMNQKANAEMTYTWTIKGEEPEAPAFKATITIGEDVIELSETEAVDMATYPEGAIIKYYNDDEAIKKAVYEIVDVTKNEILKSQGDLSKGEDGVWTAEMPREYGMAAGHAYSVHIKAFNGMSSFTSRQLYEHNYLVNGTNKDVPVLSEVSEFESVSPTEDFVIAGATTIDVRFKGEAPASATAWAIVGQGVLVPLEVEISGQTVKVKVTESVMVNGTLLIHVQAKDKDGHIIGSPLESVNPDNGSMSFVWESEVGLPMPKLVEDGKTVDAIETIEFTASQGISLNEGAFVTIDGATVKRYTRIEIQDVNGNVIDTNFSDKDFEAVGPQGGEKYTSMRLKLHKPIIMGGQYVVVLPYASFILGQEMSASTSGSATYSITVDGSLEPKPETMLGEIAVSATEEGIVVAFPAANIPEYVKDGAINFPSGVVITLGETSFEMYPDPIMLPAEKFEFVIPFDKLAILGYNAKEGDKLIVSINGIQVDDYTEDFMGRTIEVIDEVISVEVTVPEITGISELIANGVKGATFNIGGQRVNASAKGIIISGGKKYSNK